MALGTPTIVSKTQMGGTCFLLRMSFAGDSTYPGSGGTTGITTFVKTAIKTAAAAASDALVRGPETVEIVDIISGNCGAKVAFYDKANDKLKVVSIVDGSEASGTQAGTTFDMTFICK